MSIGFCFFDIKVSHSDVEYLLVWTVTRTVSDSSYTLFFNVFLYSHFLTFVRVQFVIPYFLTQLHCIDFMYFNTDIISVKKFFRITITV